MSIKINGTPADIEVEHVEWGVLFPHDPEYDSDIYEADHEQDARFVLSCSEGAKLVARKVYETAWAEVSK